MLRLRTVFLLIGILFYSVSFAQKNSFETEARVALQNYFQEPQRASLEVPDFLLNSHSFTAKSGIQHYYFVQTNQGIPIYKALASVHLDKQGEPVSINSKMIDLSVHSRISGNHNLDVLKATEIGMKSLGLKYINEVARKNENALHVFDREKNMHGPVLAEYMLLPDGTNLIPSWRIEIMDMEQHIKWQVWVNDNDGSVIRKESLTHYCAFDVGKSEREFKCNETSKLTAKEHATNFGPEATYQVLPFPTESPIHGEFEIIEEPWDLNASPYGWHDTNGFPGAESTSTSGNNVNTSLDREGNGPDSNDEAEGGDELTFIFPYDPEADPLDNAETAVTNMFYAINWMHDFSYKFGFDEASGNFQEKNYSGSGSGNDPVVSVVQNGFEASPPSLNNASMATSSEGFPPFMENRLFDASFGGAAYLEITGPSDVADFYESTPGQFGEEVSSTPIIGEIVLIEDESSPVTDGCDEIVNGTELEGKIAMIDRGNCEFGFKVLQAEEAGAIAVIVCNNQPTGLVSMGGGVHGAQVTIPSIFISQTDCQKIRIYAGDSLECIIKSPEGSTGPEYLDGAFDNGIIAHEFGHGISNRLTGGPGQTGCLNNYEQMGEGISDFFTLVSTAKPGDDGSQPKGIGTFVARQETDGLGIRRFQYTTDMSINPLTYDDIIGETSDAGIYAIGELWCSTLWDLYWLMSQAYGFDPTYTDSTAGNFKTMMLIMEGMKLQTCDPGFIDSRDAILLADETMFNSENKCIIWEAFSRRGLGESADQNDADNPNDGTEDFSIPKTCIKELHINKTSPELIQPGETYDIVLEVRNGLSLEQNNLVVTDMLQDGQEFVSSDISPEITGNELKWTIPTLQPEEEWSVSFSVKSSPSLASGRAFIDSMENNNNWFAFINTGDDQFELSDANPAGGTYSFHVPNTAVENDQQLLFLNEIAPADHDWPVIRFDHDFDTEQGIDGGVFEYSIDDASTWTNIGERFIHNPYSGRINYSTFAIYKQKAFSGQSNGYQTSYIDLSDLKGEGIFFRFRFGSDEGHLEPGSFDGWYIDNFEIMDAKGYDSPACVSSDESNQTCTDPNESITLIDSRIINSVVEDIQSSTLLVFPNPAIDQLNISAEWLRDGNPIVSLTTIDGERVYSRTGTVSSLLSISTSDFAPGFYILQVVNNGTSVTKKVIIGN